VRDVIKRILRLFSTCTYILKFEVVYIYNSPSWCCYYAVAVLSDCLALPPTANKINVDIVVSILSFTQLLCRLSHYISFV
jgi:hypothetical protein